MTALTRLLVSSGLLILPLLVQAQRTFDTDILRETFGFDDSTTMSVALEDLHQGCPARDCIPSIDAPKQVAAADATHVADDDMVIALSLHGDNRAWPARILDRHEIVNDTIGGVPIAITWCPLCGSAVDIEREVDDEVTEFGVSGVLYNSDLVFYDRNSNTLWDQDGRRYIGTRLFWFAWYTFHPDTELIR